MHKFVKAIHIIAAAADGDVKKLIELAGGNMTAFGRTYGIKLRSLQEWSAGRSKPAEFIPRMIGYAMIGDLYAAQA